MDQMKLAGRAQPLNPTRGRATRFRVVGRSAVLLCLSALVLPVTSLAGPSEDQSLEYRVKAAFLLNFTKFVEWPPAAFPSANSPMSVCIYKDDPFGRTLDQIVQGESVNDHKVAVLRSRQIPVSGTCHVLFVDKTVKDPAEVIANAGPGVLTVGEGDAFLHEGGMIAFVIENRRVRFDINLNAAVKAGLTINAKLLGVARSIEK